MDRQGTLLDEDSILPPLLAFSIALVVMRLVVTADTANRTIGVLTFTAYLVIPLITHRLHQLHSYRLQEIFAYTAVLPGLLIILLSPSFSVNQLLYSLFILSHLGYWFWSGWLYASRATELYKDGYSDILLGNGFVPVFTGIPVAVILLLVAAASRVPWAEQVGLIIYAAAAATLYLVLREG